MIFGRLALLHVAVYIPGKTSKLAISKDSASDGVHCFAV